MLFGRLKRIVFFVMCDFLSFLNLWFFHIFVAKYYKHLFFVD